MQVVSARISRHIIAFSFSFFFRRNKNRGISDENAGRGEETRRKRISRTLAQFFVVIALIGGRCLEGKHGNLLRHPAWSRIFAQFPRHFLRDLSFRHYASPRVIKDRYNACVKARNNSCVSWKNTELPKLVRSLRSFLSVVFFYGTNR